MPTLDELHTSVSAAVVLLAKNLAPWLPWPGTDELLLRLGAGRSQAYAMKARLEELLASLSGQAGRPRSSPVSDAQLLQVSQRIQDFLMRNPGSARFCGGRYSYTDGFRQFIVSLAEEGLSVAQLAEASQVPMPTLKLWFKRHFDLNEASEDPATTLRQEHCNQIVSLFQSWKGSFVAFCRMVREQYGLRYGMTAIGTLLEQLGLRRRKKRDKPAPWSADTYRKLFPGAQWLGDGSTLKVHGIPVTWGEETFSFNLELILDVGSNALVGMSITKTEDEQAVLTAFDDALTTAETAPTALSLDNRSSNHTSAIQEALSRQNTTLLATTLGRGQSKAPLEGSFGLFKQELPCLWVGGQSASEHARAVLELVVCAWARGRNGRPRKSLGNRSPADYYQSYQPSAEEVEQARQWAAELQRRQEKMRETREQRTDPEKLSFLRESLATLGIPDPKNTLSVSLACYSRDAIVTGVSLFQAKHQQGTLPSAADLGRYLGGIIRNLHEQNELALTTEFHLRNRERLQELCLKTLVRREQHLLQQQHTEQELLQSFIDLALSARHAVDYHFWAGRCARLTTTPELYRAACRRIALAYRCSSERKRALHARLSVAILNAA